ncbi:Integrase core domain [Pandoraea pnomenusa]|uniref:Integrase core domain n=1 Tax=Pandoraea pnomenusa TaxID=93220 RepID=A0A378YUU0_9BURK|nr:Integrase core domain [Pandoraea pnomenusa]
MSKQRRTFSPEFKRSAASLVLDQSYSHVDASRSVGLRSRFCAVGFNNCTRNAKASSESSNDARAAADPGAGRAGTPREGEEQFKKRYCATDVGTDRTYEIIDQVGHGVPVAMLCELFDIARSCFYAYRHRRERVDATRIALRSRVQELFAESRSSAGSRSIMGMLREQGATIGRFKVSPQMDELGLICKQPGNHAYKRATVERIDIPIILNREFDVAAPNQVWCGDITYLWAQGRRHCLAVVLDLFTRRVVGWSFSTSPDAGSVAKAL